MGDNTDVHGVEAALQSVGFNPQGKKIVIMGRGGGAKAATAAVRGASIVRVLSRDEVSGAAGSPCDLLINATPVGMFPKIEDSPIKGNIAADVVFDMVYNPRNDCAPAHGSSPGKDNRSGNSNVFCTGRTPV